MKLPLFVKMMFADFLFGVIYHDTKEGKENTGSGKQILDMSGRGQGMSVPDFRELFPLLLLLFLLHSPSSSSFIYLFVLLFETRSQVAQVGFEL